MIGPIWKHSPVCTLPPRPRFAAIAKRSRLWGRSCQKVCVKISCCIEPIGTRKGWIDTQHAKYGRSDGQSILTSLWLYLAYSFNLDAATCLPPHHRPTPVPARPPSRLLRAGSWGPHIESRKDLRIKLDQRSAALSSGWNSGTRTRPLILQSIPPGIPDRVRSRGLQ